MLHQLWIRNKTFRIELPEDSQFCFALTPYIGQLPIGYARLTNNDGQVTLGDILIYDKAGFYWPCQPFRVRFNFRSQGYGSKLLKAVIQHCRSIGAISIEGKMVGDPEILRPWYQKHGFSIDEQTNLLLKL
ncbi:GNAT family N-acetyltransferase [Aliamphritea hakodatensis]|uniref:GNAT family N-acetyltransferase n=1 Tax=Aliamphritea hakodatensis TaxID=2895352 RepID=UPI0022FD5E7C|nr:GNAT family N-acetyltransferase [Aliamphritea hakodatensis]